MTLNAFIEAVAEIENRLRDQPDTETPVHELDQATTAVRQARAAYMARAAELSETGKVLSGPFTLRGQAVANACAAAPGMMACPCWRRRPLQPFTADMDRRVVSCAMCRPLVAESVPAMFAPGWCSFCMDPVEVGESLYTVLTRVALVTIEGTACGPCHQVLAGIAS